jgi:phosphosulfolactate synthase (CoM biosynthesis protein A)
MANRHPHNGPAPAARQRQRNRKTDEDELTLPFLDSTRRRGKPHRIGLTEIRGPYYTSVTPSYLEELLAAVGHAVDSFKFGGGAFAVLRRSSVQALIDICHRHEVTVSTGGFVEYVLTQGPAAVDHYIDECRRLGFDTIEVSAGFISIPTDDLLRVVERVRRCGLKAKPEVGIQFGAGGASTADELEAEGVADVDAAVARAKRFLDAGAELIMIESEGITESVKRWRTDVPAKFAEALGAEHVMFEAADPQVFDWYIKHFGPDVNLFVDHSQIVQLECLRCGIWGTKGLWGRVVRYAPKRET